MAADPLTDLMALATATPDPRLVSNWITAYLGKRDLKAKRVALRALQSGCEAKTATADLRAARMILGIIRKLEQTIG